MLVRCIEDALPFVDDRTVEIQASMMNGRLSATIVLTLKPYTLSEEEMDRVRSSVGRGTFISYDLFAERLYLRYDSDREPKRAAVELAPIFMRLLSSVTSLLAEKHRSVETFIDNFIESVTSLTYRHE